jgi:hypothetical protein
MRASVVALEVREGSRSADLSTEPFPRAPHRTVTLAKYPEETSASAVVRFNAGRYRKLPPIIDIQK